jgi:hypothetical protein
MRLAESEIMSGSIGMVRGVARLVGVVVVVVGAAGAACSTETPATGGTGGAGGSSGSAGRGSGGNGAVAGTGAASGANAGGHGGTGPEGGRAGATSGGAAGVGGESPLGCTVIDDLTARYPFEPCTGNGCPTLEQDLAELRDSVCDRPVPDLASVKAGCGFVEVRYGQLYSNSARIYDASTHRQVGYDSFVDLPRGECWRMLHIGGVTFPDCSDAITCPLCEPDVDPSGSAGEGGGAGQAGAGGASSCLAGILE